MDKALIVVTVDGDEFPILDINCQNVRDIRKALRIADREHEFTRIHSVDMTVDLACTGRRCAGCRLVEVRPQGMMRRFAKWPEKDGGVWCSMECYRLRGPR